MTTFNQLSGILNPLEGIDFGDFSAPVFADINGDGILDLTVGDKDGKLSYYQNTGSATAPNYVEQSGSANPFNDLDVGFFSAPTFADINDDGKLDLVVGDRNGGLNFYQNTSLDNTPVYTALIGASNPFDGIDTGDFATPVFADIDGDGKKDVVVGDFTGAFRYYKNTGTVASPTYTEQTGASNPFDGIDAGTRSVPTFADVDVDGDLDLIAGGNNGTLKYYENTGSANAPIYVEKTGVDNPFDAVSVGSASSPTFTDGDGDGDLDLYVGDKDGMVSYYENATTPIVDTLVTLTGGSLVITDANGSNSDDELILTEVAGTLTISDTSGKGLKASGAATQAGADVQVAVASLTSPVVINLGDGTNTLVAAGITSDLEITGGSGYSIIKSGVGNDVINGGTGKSKIEGGAGADTLNGGSGNSDTVEYTSSAAGVVVDLGAATASGGDATGDTIINFENISGSAQDDSLTGDSGKNILRGRAGNDIIIGNDGNDRLFGDDGDDTIMGGAGNDYIWGGAGADVIDGGAGNNTIYYRQSSVGVTVSLAAGGGSAGDATGDVISNVRNINGSNFGDFMIGDSANNRLVGYDGNDVLIGEEGNDKLIGGNGEDVLQGGIGADILSGGIGNDNFVFDALTDSLLGSRDRITDFAMGADNINVNASVVGPVAQLGTAANFGETAIRAVLNETDFLANSAATFSLGSNTFVAINDDTAGFSAASDSVIEITGFTGSLSDLTVVGV